MLQHEIDRAEVTQLDTQTVLRRNQDWCCLIKSSDRASDSIFAANGPKIPVPVRARSQMSIQKIKVYSAGGMCVHAADARILSSKNLLRMATAVWMYATSLKEASHGCAVGSLVQRSI